MLTTRPLGISSGKDKLVATMYSRETIGYVWDEMMPILKKSVDASRGMMSLPYLADVLTSGEGVAFVTLRDNRLESVLVCRIQGYTDFKSVFILACAGKNLREAMKHMDLMVSWALQNECSEIEGWVEPAMARLISRFGFRLKKQIYSLDLRSKLQ